MADLLFLFFLSSLLLPKSAVGYDLRDSEVFTCLLRDKYNQIPKTCKQTDIHFEPYQGGMLMFRGFMPLWWVKLTHSLKLYTHNQYMATPISSAQGWSLRL